ncbi:MAG: hypothetical protein FWE90_11195 [Defluviitaleaceae bacterium]|nr:hypothetical protein [Defluviitaleaceae bacterium]
MSTAQQIGSMLEQMPERKQSLILELIKTMISPDDYLSNDDIADIQQARLEYARGEYVREDEINWK